MLGQPSNPDKVRSENSENLILINLYSNFIRILKRNFSAPVLIRLVRQDVGGKHFAVGFT